RFSGLTAFKYGKLSIDDSGVVLFDRAFQHDFGTHASRVLLGPESEKVAQIMDRRILQRFPNGDVLLANEPYQQVDYPSFPVDRLDHPPAIGTVRREGRSGTTLWRRQFDVREVNPIQVTPFHLLARTSDDRVTVVDLKDGKDAWSLAAPKAFDGY